MLRDRVGRRRSRWQEEAEAASGAPAAAQESLPVVYLVPEHKLFLITYVDLRRTQEFPWSLVKELFDSCDICCIGTKLSEKSKLECIQFGNAERCCVLDVHGEVYTELQECLTHVFKSEKKKKALWDARKTMFAIAEYCGSSLALDTIHEMADLQLVHMYFLQKKGLPSEYLTSLESVMDKPKLELHLQVKAQWRGGSFLQRGLNDQLDDAATLHDAATAVCVLAQFLKSFYQGGKDIKPELYVASLARCTNDSAIRQHLEEDASFLDSHIRDFPLDLDYKPVSRTDYSVLEGRWQELQLKKVELEQRAAVGVSTGEGVPTPAYGMAPLFQQVGTGHAVPMYGMAPPVQQQVPWVAVPCLVCLGPAPLFQAVPLVPQPMNVNVPAIEDLELKMCVREGAAPAGGLAVSAGASAACASSPS